MGLFKLYCLWEIFNEVCKRSWNISDQLSKDSMIIWGSRKAGIKEFRSLWDCGCLFFLFPKVPQLLLLHFFSFFFFFSFLVSIGLFLFSTFLEKVYSFFFSTTLETVDWVVSFKHLIHTHSCNFSSKVLTFSLGCLPPGYDRTLHML